MSDGPSTTTPSAPGPAMPSPFRLIATLGLIAMLSGFTIVLVYQVTLGPIERNHREALAEAVFEVLPGAVSRANFRMEDEALQALDDEAFDRANVYAGYDEEGQLVGVALEGSGQGYGGTVRVLFGYAPDRERIIGYTVLQSSETPGLGDTIETEPHFLENFDDLDASLNEEKSALQNPITLVPQSEKENPWEIDGISGATVSSRAVADAVGQSAERNIPVIYRQADVLRKNREGGAE